MRSRVASLVAAAALAVPALALAQAAPPSSPPAAAPLVHTEVDLGYVSTAGNTSVRTLNLGEQVLVTPAPWKFTQTFSIVNGSTAGVETVNTLTAGLRADYAVGARFSFFGLGHFTRNRFAGIARRFEESAGLAYGVLAGPTSVLDVEAGGGRNQQTGTTGATQNYWNGRLAARYRLNFTTKAYFEQKVEGIADLQNLKNTLINTATSLVAPITAGIGLTLGYVVHFQNQPQPGFKKTDTILSAGLQLQF